MISWLGLCTFTVKGTNFIHGWGSKILQEVPYGNKETKNKTKKPKTICSNV